MRLLIVVCFCTLAACTRENEPGRTADAGPPACRDEDRDGYGEGAGCRDVDCDDTQNMVHPGAVETCDGLDNDCNGAVDDGIVTPDCALTTGVCAGSRRRCVEGVLAVCTAASYGADYEETESRCDGLDNDCDGVVDAQCPCEPGSTQPCGESRGECGQGIQRCVGGQWGACEGAVEPAAETCNGRDDDCDGTLDEGVEAPSCALTAGLCAGTRSRCMGGMFIECGPVEYGPNYTATETSAQCDQADNDCDGVVDEGGCECPEGTDRECGLSEGACEPGRQICRGGTWGACEGGTGVADEQCNGVDDDCDAALDEGLVGPACALQQGVCAGTTQACGGMAGFAACDAARYGPSYRAEEGADDCEGLDNDCDGLTDEACVIAPVLISEVRPGGPGDDALSAFIELVGPPGQSLNGYTLEAVNGSGGRPYRTIALEGSRIANTGYFLIVDEGAQGVLRDLAHLVARGADLQNGPDSLRLLRNGQAVDALGYGQFGDGDVFAGEGMPAPDPGDGSLSRDAANTDTDNNANDFSVLAMPTPGGGPIARLHVTLRWDQEPADLDLHLMRGAFGSEDDCHWGDRTPPWGPNGERGDPILYADVRNGPGPEVIDYREPAPRDGEYLVLAHYPADAEDPEVQATVELTIDGAAAGGAFQQVLTPENAYWAVAVITVSAERIIAVERIDLVGNQPLEP